MKKIIIRQPTTGEELKKVFSIRREVFVREQRIFMDSDIDEHDKESIYLIAESKDGIIGTVRVYPERNDSWAGSRLAVKKEFRGSVAGILLVKGAVKLVKSKNCRRFTARIQLQNVMFFKQLGWRPVGEVFDHMKIPHQLMEADLDTKSLKS